MQKTLAAISLVALAATALPAKDPTRKLMIWRGGLAGGVEIVDSATLAQSNVYSGNFLATPGAVVPPPSSAPRYQITFYLPDHRGWLYDITHRPRLKVAYVVDFVPDVNHRGGYVYVPGPGDTWSSWNRGAITREQYEGRWSAASPEWAERINAAIARGRRLPAPSCPDSGAWIGRDNPLYGEVSSLTGLLEKNGLHVLCAYITTYDGTLGRRAAGIVTSLGPFAVLFFPSTAETERVGISSRIVDGQVVTTLQSPDPRQRPVTMYSADKTDFLAHGPWFFDTWGQPQLRAAIATALAHERDAN